jgi:hypothetical protein
MNKAMSIIASSSHQRSLPLSTPWLGICWHMRAAQEKAELKFP